MEGKLEQKDRLLPEQTTPLCFSISDNEITELPCISSYNEPVTMVYQLAFLSC